MLNKYKVSFDRSKSYKNCHAPGVYSLYIRDGCKLFYVSAGHSLWRNFPYTTDMSIGFHSHTTSLLINKVFGVIWHYKGVTSHAQEGGGLAQFVFDSKIKGGKGEFRFASPGQWAGFRLDRVLELRMTSIDTLPIGHYHTIAVDQGKEACWITKDIPTTSPYVFNDGFCFSNRDLTQWNADDYYQPIDEVEWDAILTKIQHRVDNEYWWIKG
jgi:hypothetical protein